jgi:hypothetical protein
LIDGSAGLRQACTKATQSFAKKTRQENPSKNLGGRHGACVTNKAKDLPAVMVERFGDANGFVGRPRVAAAE